MSVTDSEDEDIVADDETSADEVISAEDESEASSFFSSGLFETESEEQAKNAPHNRMWRKSIPKTGIRLFIPLIYTFFPTTDNKPSVRRGRSSRIPWRWHREGVPESEGRISPHRNRQGVPDFLRPEDWKNARNQYGSRGLFPVQTGRRKSSEPGILPVPPSGGASRGQTSHLPSRANFRQKNRDGVQRLPRAHPDAAAPHS